jgi:hypothetical protein
MGSRYFFLAAVGAEEAGNPSVGGVVVSLGSSSPVQGASCRHWRGQEGRPGPASRHADLAQGSGSAAAGHQSGDLEAARIRSRPGGGGAEAAVPTWPRGGGGAAEPRPARRRERGRECR